MTDVGRTGEAVAAKYYQQRGWLLLNHNYRTRLGELDLILYKENTLVFAEVKRRTSTPATRRDRFRIRPQSAAHSNGIAPKKAYTYRGKRIRERV